MKIKFSDQHLTQAVTLSVGVGQEEVDLPELAAGDAVLLKNVFATLDASSAAPSVTAAGLTIFGMTLCGKEQPSPADLLSLERLLWMRIQTTGSTTGGPFSVSAEWTFAPDAYRPRFPSVPTRELFAFHHTSNITNAATTIIRLRVIYDIVTLTGAEQLAYLL